MDAMDERKKKILQAIVDSYIRNAEPVGSRSISRSYNLGISPATIRNEMSDLEEKGYLAQPHTSAGRVPSDLGYRFYVDCLMQKGELTEWESDYIRKEYEERQKELEVLIKQTSKLLSQITNYISLVQGPRWQESTFKHLRLIPLEEKSVMVVMITDTGLIRNKVVELQKPLDSMQLEGITWLLNNKLRGASLEKIEKIGWQEIERTIQIGSNLLEQTMGLFSQALDSPEEKVYLEGTVKILDHPEFRNLEKFKSLMGTLEKSDLLSQVLTENSKEGEVRVTIGEENKHLEMKDCSIVTATYQVGGKTFGTIGVLGPTRMDYGKVVSVVEVVAKALGEILNKSGCNK